MNHKGLANSRKRPHNASAYNANAGDDTHDSHEQDADEHVPSQKRSRVTDWPLKSPDPVTQIASPLTSRKRNGKKNTRPSKFKEGSLGDKPSKLPPASYIGDEDVMERYMNRDKEIVDMDVEYDAGIETSKHSGMFRFGKAIANALNPTAVWQGINGMWKETKPSVETNILDERQLKAVEAYVELKKNGYKGTQSTTTLSKAVETQKVSSTKKEDDQESRRSSFRDSAVDVDEYKARNSNESQADGSLKPPSIARRSVSPFSDSSSRRKSVLHLRTPSFQSLRKVRSNVHLPSSKKKDETPPVPPPAPGAPEAIQPGLGLTRQPSKKEIAKQFKLSKKVSDLEVKLTNARRELEHSRNDVPPVPDLPARVVRKPFTPGNLPSLPSERLLMAHAANINNLQLTPKTQPMPANVVSTRQGMTPQQAASWLDVQPRAAIVDTTQEEDLAMWQAAKQSQSTRKPKRRLSQPKREHSGQSPTGIKKRAPKVPSKTPTNSPQLIKDKLPALPSSSSSASTQPFDPSQINPDRIKALRAIPNPHLPLGKSYDDLPNLRKRYPSASEAQLTEYIASFTTSKKTTNHLELTPGNRSLSPFVAGSPSVSPMKTRSGANDRRGGPLPPLPHQKGAGAKKSRTDLEKDGRVKGAVGEANAKKSDNWESLGGGESPVSGDLVKTAGRIGRDQVGRGVMVGEVSAKEDFKWDEDVF